MAEFFDHITEKHAAFIKEQPVFFAATACDTGRINLSPKGMDTFRVLGPNLCGYLDLTGSGNETAIHIERDGRLTFMFNSFTRKALIYRLYGRGEVVEKGSEKWEDLKDQFPTDIPGARQLILMHVESTQTSCGYAVPEMEMVKERQTLVNWADKKGDKALEDYRVTNNQKSIDGFVAAD